jgi:hypothetical protein
MHMLIMMEQNNQGFIRHNQGKIRAEVYQCLSDFARDGDGNLILGRRAVLPSSFVGGFRYMLQLYQDAMRIV